MKSLVIPVYRNEENLDRLLPALAGLAGRIGDLFEVIFVVDGSPDRCLELLRQRLPHLGFETQLISLSRNFGSFAAIAAGMTHARGDAIAVMAADLQEPPELIEEFFRILGSGATDIVFGVRSRRADPWFSTVMSDLFWSLFRRFVIRDIPAGGVDVFACTKEIRDRLIQFREIDTNLVALLFWLGFRRQYVVYERQRRLEGKSAWTFRKKVRYCINSIFNFTDLPIRLLLYGGGAVLIGDLLASVSVILAKLDGRIPVPGYTAIFLSILFFGSLACIGLGVVGQYLWLTLQNTRGRPNYIVQSVEYPGGNSKSD